MTPPSTITAGPAGTTFIPYANKDSGFSGVAPEGWVERGPGEFGRGDPATDPTFLVQAGVPGTTIDLVTEDHNRDMSERQELCQSNP